MDSSSSKDGYKISYYLQRYLDEMRISRSPYTVKSLKSILIPLERDMGKSVEKIKKEDLIHYYNHLRMEKNLKDSTICSMQRAIKVFYKYAEKNKFITKNPAADIPLVIRPYVEPEYLSKDEVDRLIATAIDPRKNLMVKTLFYTGCRCGELVDIRRKDINFERREITLRGKAATGTGPRTRRIFIVPQLYQDLLDYVTVNNIKYDQRVFPVTTRTIQYDLKILGRQAEIDKNVKPVMLRHSFATYLLSQGMDVRAIKEFMGHVDLSSTGVYTHLNIDDYRSSFENAFNPKEGQQQAQVQARPPAQQPRVNVGQASLSGWTQTPMNINDRVSEMVDAGMTNDEIVDLILALKKEEGRKRAKTPGNN